MLPSQTFPSIKRLCSQRGRRNHPSFDQRFCTGFSGACRLSSARPADLGTLPQKMKTTMSAAPLLLSVS